MAQHACGHLHSSRLTSKQSSEALFAFGCKRPRRCRSVVSAALLDQLVKPFTSSGKASALVFICLKGSVLLGLAIHNMTLGRAAFLFDEVQWHVMWHWVYS